ncbi:MAG: hypothetical protein IJO73_02170 [Clostridia bacterium]|nr:hypothetical protein [Clostridia bacterium]
MNMHKKAFFSVILIITIVASFFVGKYVTRVENTNVRSGRCSTLIGFAIDKAENGDLTDQGTIKALVSNVYAAYQFCDNSVVANQLHDLWNFLVFESNNNLENTKEITLIELNDALRAIKESD